MTWKLIVHDTAVCRNPQVRVHSFTGNRNDLTYLNRPTVKYIMFLRKYKKEQLCCGHNILTEGVSVTQLSSDGGISVWRIVWVMTNCCFLTCMFVGGKLQALLDKSNHFPRLHLYFFMFLKVLAATSLFFWDATWHHKVIGAPPWNPTNSHCSKL